MKSISKLIVMAVACATLSGCYYQNVPAAHKGKILNPSGFSPDVLEPGRHSVGYRGKLVLLETGTVTKKETVKVIMADKLTLHADVRFRGRISGSNSTLNGMFNDIVLGKSQDTIKFNQVYATYGAMLVRNQARAILSGYTVNDVHTNYARISSEIGSALAKALQNTPMEISDITLGNIQYPGIVTEAIENAKKAEMKIEEQNANNKIALNKEKNARALAEARYQTQMTEAKTLRDYNHTIAEGITPELLELKRLEMMEKVGQSGNAVYLPYEAMSNTGAQVKMFN